MPSQGICLLACGLILCCPTRTPAQIIEFVAPVYSLTSSTQPPTKDSPGDDYSLEMPTAKQLFRLESEAEAQQSIRRDAFARKIKNVEFPRNPPPLLVIDKVQRPYQVIFQESTLMCFRRTIFQDNRTEREGLSCGVLEPFRSATLFYGRALSLPVLVLIARPGQFQCWEP